jgi:hypothetical protein
MLPGLTAGAIAGLVSGLPSTLHALLTGRDPLAAARAAGNLVLPADAPPARLLLAGAAVHTVVSLGWGTVLGMALPRFLALPTRPERAVSPGSPAPPFLPAPRVSPWLRGTWWGALSGLLIAALDLGVIGRRRPLIRDLPVLPQVADHLAFGAVAGAVVARSGGG